VNAATQTAQLEPWETPPLDRFPADEPDPEPPPGASDAPPASERERRALKELATPTQREPLRGLPYLARVALVGRDRIREIANAPVPYVWLHIAVAATIVVLAGGPGEGKTTLLFLVLVARMNVGDPVTVLGLRVEPAPTGKWIVLIEGEHGEASTSRKLVKSCALLGVDDIALERIIIVARRAVRIGSPEWNEVTKLVAAGLVSDIALDTIARVAPADGNDEREQVAIFELIAQTIDAAPCDADKPIVWAAAHTRKNANGELADVSGSAQRTGQADTVLLVKGERLDGRIVSSTVTFAKLREDPDDYPTPVTFAISRDEHGTPRIVIADVREDTDAPLETRILTALATGPRTKSALATKLARSRADIEGAITTLFAARRIARANVKIGGREFPAFTLRQDGSRSAPAKAPDEAPDVTS
jgi:hypothetical protein